MYLLDTSSLHPSTALTLEAMQAFQPGAAPGRVLDMGCGNGILSLVAAEMWDARVIGADVSEMAINDANSAKTLPDARRSAENVTFVRGDRFAHPLIPQVAPYDVIIANMLDQWLVEMALDIKNHLIPGGYAMLSGMLHWLYADTKQGRNLV